MPQQEISLVTLADMLSSGERLLQQLQHRTYNASLTCYAPDGLEALRRFWDTEFTLREAMDLMSTIKNIVRKEVIFGNMEVLKARENVMTLYRLLKRLNRALDLWKSVRIIPSHSFGITVVLKKLIDILEEDVMTEIGKQRYLPPRQAGGPH